MVGVRKTQDVSDRRVIGETVSLCPVCLKRIPASIIENSGSVYMEKTCFEHGRSMTLLWRDDAESYLNWIAFGDPDLASCRSSARQWDGDKGCPFDCGLCSEHLRDTCSAAIMTTSKCDLSCSFCFTSSQEPHLPSLGEIRAMYEFYRQAADGSNGKYPVELCGGEPTTRDDLPEIVAIGRDMGFDYIQVNTNGVRIGRDEEYLFRLKEAGLTTVYLSFDGVSDGPYERIAGRRLFDIKVQALANCERARIAVVLVPLVVPGVNDDQLGAIVQFAKERVPTVKGVFFQPVSYFGKCPVACQPVDNDRITIPDVLSGLEAQTHGEVRKMDFVPPRCEHPLCSFHGFFFVGRDGSLKATTKFQPRNTVSEPESWVRRFTKRFWTYNQDMYLTVGGMAFQDAWNVDLHRLKRCTIHIVLRERKLVPLCAKYLTSASGARLYPGIA